MTPFIDRGGWRQLFLHLLSNIEDLVLFGWPFPGGTSSVHNAHFVIPITNLLYLCRKEFIVIFNNSPVTNLDWLFFCRVSRGLIGRKMNFFLSFHCIICQNEGDTATILNGEVVEPSNSFGGWDIGEHLNLTASFIFSISDVVISRTLTCACPQPSQQRKTRCSPLFASFHCSPHVPFYSATYPFDNIVSTHNPITT